MASSDGSRKSSSHALPSIIPGRVSNKSCATDTVRSTRFSSSCPNSWRHPPLLLRSGLDPPPSVTTRVVPATDRVHQYRWEDPGRLALKGPGILNFTPAVPWSSRPQF